MKMPTTAFVVVSLVAAGGGTGAAETGDFNGDGQLDLADLQHGLTGQPPAPGSRHGFDAHPCQGAPHYWTDNELLGLTFLEILRRNVPDPLPLWQPLWTSSPGLAPLPVHPDFWVRIEPVLAAGGEDDGVTIPITITSLAPVAAFFLILEAAEGVLRVDGIGDDFDANNHWSQLSTHSLANVTHGSSQFFSVTVPDSLVTGGRCVVTYNVPRTQSSLLGETSIAIRARLRRGVAAGFHELRVLPGSQVLFEDGRVAAPFVESPGDIVVQSDVTGGWDGAAIFDLQADPATLNVGGKVEFRAVSTSRLDAEPEAAAPIDHVRPGDELTVRVQMKTAVPLNEISFDLRWPSGAFDCVEPAGTLLFTNPEDGMPYAPDDSSLWCYPAFQFGDGAHQARFALIGASVRTGRTSYKGRPLEYFHPLDAWTDLTEIRLKVPATARDGETIPLHFLPADPTGGLNPGLRDPRAAFMPYGVRYPCDTTRRTDDLPDAWSYDLILHDAFVAVLGDGEPDPDPVDGGIRVVIGSGAARPGETVEVPVYASALSRLLTLRLALQVDPAVATVEALRCRFVNLVEGTEEWVELRRGERATRVYCDDPEALPQERVCKEGMPLLAIFQNTEPESTLADLIIGNDAADYPGAELNLIATLVIRVRDDTAAVEAPILPAVVTWSPGQFPVESETGGSIFPEQNQFAPASSVNPGSISVLGRGFLRGDANGDGKVDLSDAVAALAHLFLGNTELRCLDAADADDSGVVEITDPIFLLGALFLGTKTLPAPYPACGTDVAMDTLGCTEGCP